MIDAVVAVGVERCLELFVRLIQGTYVMYHVTQVYVVIGSTMDKQKMSFQVCCIHNR